MKKLLYCLVMVVFAYSCNESYIDKLDHSTTLSQVQSFTYELVDDDYKTLVNLKEALLLADSIDPQGVEAQMFHEIGTNRYFANSDQVHLYLPVFIKYRMPYLSEGSVINLKYKLLTYTEMTIDTITVDTLLVLTDSCSFRLMASNKWMAAIYYLVEPFENTQGDFTVLDVVMDEGLTYVWTTTAKYGMKASAYVDKKNKASESWLISPTMDFSNAINPILSFEQASQYMKSAKDSLSYKEVLSDRYLVLASKNYSGDVTTCQWEVIPYNKDSKGEYIVPDGNSWDFVSTGNLDMSVFNGEKQVTIAFRYVSDTLAAGTWEVKNIEIREVW